MTKEAKALYEEFKQYYIETGYMYSGAMSYSFDKKEAFDELYKRGIIQLRDCDAVGAYELVAIERRKLVKGYDLDAVWRKKYRCFLINGEFDEIQKLYL